MVDFKQLNEDIASLPASSIGDEVQRIIDNGPSVIATLTSIVSAYSNAYRGIQVIQRNADTGELEDITDSNEFKDRLQIPNNVLATMWANALPAISVMADARRHSRVSETTILTDTEYDKLMEANAVERLPINILFENLHVGNIQFDASKAPLNLDRVTISQYGSVYDNRRVAPDVVITNNMSWTIGWGYRILPLINSLHCKIDNEDPVIATITNADATYDSIPGSNVGLPKSWRKLSGDFQPINTAIANGTDNHQHPCYFQAVSNTTWAVSEYADIRISALYAVQHQLEDGQLNLIMHDTQCNFDLVLEFYVWVYQECVQPMMAYCVWDGSKWTIRSAEINTVDDIHTYGAVFKYPCAKAMRNNVALEAVAKLGTFSIRQIAPRAIMINQSHDKVSVSGAAFDGGNAYKSAYKAIRVLRDFMNSQGLPTGLTAEMNEAIDWDFIDG